MRLPLLIISLCSLAGACARDVSTPPARVGTTPLRDTLAALTKHFADSLHLPGLAVGIWQGDSLLFDLAQGRSALPGGAPISTASVFHMASISKPFVATAIMQLVERRQLELDAPITQYLPYFRMKDARAARITARQLLRHVAGLPDVTDYRWDHAEYDAGSLERYIRELKDSSLVGEPGVAPRYSNIGFEVLADVVAKVSGESFDDYMQRHILTPLKMTQSTFLMTDMDSSRMAWGHSADSASGQYRRTAVYPYNRRHAGSSTLHSSINDMMRWVRANLRGGELDGVRIMQPETHAELWKPSWDLTGDVERDAKKAGVPMPYDSLALGYSWERMVRRGRLLVMHSGSDVGFSTDMVLAPRDSLGIVVLVNADGVDTRTLSFRLLDRVGSARLVPGGSHRE
ncbi:MAG: beta-lactamase family protein [Gemmatimonadaceae bacterium]|nr:beta-lactamase family protein [Gemmatimonadaceae bacterium]